MRSSTARAFNAVQFLVLLLIFVNAAAPARLPGWREASPPVAVVLMGFSSLTSAVKVKVELGRWNPILLGFAALCMAAAAGMVLT